MKSYVKNDKNIPEKDRIRLILADRLSKSRQKPIHIQKNNRKVYAVSSMQRHMLEHEAMNEGGGAYNLVSCVEVYGSLNIEAMQNSVNCLIRGNSSFRTKFVKTAEGYQQLIEDESYLKVEVTDISGQSLKEKLVEEIILQEMHFKMQMDRPPLLRMKIIRHEKECFTVIITIHHTIVDGWSFGIIIDQLQKYYNEYCLSGHVIPSFEEINYIDYCIWKDLRESDKDYWIEELKGSTVLNLESDGERIARPAYEGRRFLFTMEQHLVDKMRQYSKAHQVTMSNIVMAAYQILLSKCTGQDDIVIGLALANRGNLAISHMIGCFINTLAIRSFPEGHKRAIDFLMAIQQKSYEVLNHQNVDLHDIMDQIECEKSLFRVNYNYENTPKTELNFDGLEVRTKDFEKVTTLFDLTLSIFDAGKDLTGFIEYKSEVFCQQRVKEMYEYLVHIISSCIEDENITIQDISLLSQEQEKTLLEINTKQEVGELLFLDRFKKIVSKWGERTAVYFEECYLTYKELDRRSDVVAHILIEQAAPWDYIGVYMYKSLEAIVAILSIFKAGMTYIPIDPDYPEERIRFMIKDAGIHTVLMQSEDNNIFIPELADIDNILYMDNMRDIEESFYEHNDVNINPEDIAYIIYTSGSTGSPKGVMVPHRGLCNTIEEQKRLFSVSEKSRILQFASLCFDTSIFEILMAFGQGAALYVVDKQNLLGNRLIKFADEKGLTHIGLPPAVLALADYADLEKLEVIMVGGDVCPDNLVKVWGKKYKFYNIYGPTEATVWSTAIECFSGEKVTIGKPLNNVEVYVLDKHLNLTPLGYIGELYIGGIGLCKGYLNREELNHEKFIRKRFHNGYETDLYATGDLVRLNVDFKLEFIGRKDNQVKIRGFRIETDEIRTAMLSNPYIKDVAVGVLKKSGMDVLYAVAKADCQLIKSQDIKNYLHSLLPHYMIPSLISIMPDIPLTLNGKIDYKAIEKRMIIQADTVREIKKPETEIQHMLHSEWTKLLDIEAVGINEDFFEMGGHSLTAAKLVNYINEQFCIEFTISMVFSYPTILEMETAIRNMESAEIIPFKKTARLDKNRLSIQQKRIWFMEQIYPDTGSYNILTPIHLKGKLDVEALEKSFHTVIDFHEILKVNFHEEKGIPYQIVDYNRKLTISHAYLDNLLFKPEDQINRLIGDFSKCSFDLSKDLLIKVLLIHIHEQEHILVINMHHIISDGWSMEIFMNELSKIYNQCLGDKDDDNTLNNNQPDTKLQYFDYIEWLEKKETFLIRQKEYWKQALNPEIPPVTVPADYKRPMVLTHNGYTIERDEEEEITSKIKTFCSAQKITVFMFMMSAFSILLHKLTGQCDIPVGVPVSGRSQKETEDMIGIFINTLVIRCRISPNDTIFELMEGIKEVSIEGFKNQDVPFEDIVQMLCPDRDFSQPSLVQVMLNVQNFGDIKFRLKGVKAIPYPVIQENAKFDMTLYVEEHINSIKLRMVYNCDLFTESRIKEYLNQLEYIAEEILRNPYSKINELSIQTPEFMEVLRRNHSYAVSRKEFGNMCLDDAVAATAVKYPDRIAVIDRNVLLTYHMLEDKANILANILWNRNICKNKITIIYGARDARLVVSMLAVLKTGAAFCIFDPEYPEERLNRQFDEIGANAAIILNNKITDSLNTRLHTLKTCGTYEELMESSLNRHSAEFHVEKSIKDTAYVLFTSGTTAIPNCVSTPHGPVSHFIAWFTEHYLIDESCVFGLFSGLSHDPLIREIFTPLFTGGKVAIQNRESQYDVEECLYWAKKQHINEMIITPSLWMMISGEHDILLPDIKHYFFGGEGLGPAHIQRVRKMSPNARCVNFYGATETPQVMGYFDVPEEFNVNREIVPIQGGIDEVELYLMNEYGLEAGLGEPGEIYIRTTHLSNGYLNNDKLTQEKFVSCSDRKEYRIYKTGDIGRYQCDGSIVIHGRKDGQINIHGYRIETREIEMVLLKHKNIINAVVQHMEIKQRKLLVAYMVLRDKEAFVTDEVRGYLMSYLPANILPEQFVLLDSIPLTPNGKVDYRRLPVDLEEHLKEATLPEDEIEAKIMKIWSNVLGTENFGIHDNFFDIGGHSLLLVQVRAVIKDVFKVEIKIMDLFHYHSVRQLSQYIKSQRTGATAEAWATEKEVRIRVRRQQQAYGKFRDLRG